MASKIEMTGLRFGRLTVIRCGGSASGGLAWVCLCDCGGTSTVRGDHLRRGKITSCKCYRRENLLSLRTKHGRAGTPEYVTWKGIKTRCSNKNEPGWHLYGGRGINVCRRWLKGDGVRSGFECFLADMGPRPSDDHSIDRYPDNDGNYEPDNCRWATPKQQAANRRPRPKIAA